MSNYWDYDEPEYEPEPVLELKKELENLQAENAELRAILKNFLTESECKRTWLEEMQATIETLLEEQSE